MVERRLSTCARWSLILGFFIPLFGFFMIHEYDHSESAFVNAMTKQVEFPFMRGNNPIVCWDHDLRSFVGGALGQHVEAVYACNLPTRVSYLSILYVGGALLLIGIIGLFSREEIANMWPTEWSVFDKSSVQKYDSESEPEPRPEINVELDRNITGKDAGF